MNRRDDPLRFFMALFDQAAWAARSAANVQRRVTLVETLCERRRSELAAAREARRERRRATEAAVTVQAFGRMALSVIKFQTFRAAAVTLQRWFRQWDAEGDDDDSWSGDDGASYESGSIDGTGMLSRPTTPGSVVRKGSVDSVGSVSGCDSMSAIAAAECQRPSRRRSSRGCEADCIEALVGRRRSVVAGGAVRWRRRSSLVTQHHEAATSIQCCYRSYSARKAFAEQQRLIAAQRYGCG